MSIRAVCFDLGGVLVQIHHTWEGALRAAGFPEACAEPERELPATPAIHDFQAGLISADEYARTLAQYLGLPTPASAGRVHANILRSPYPGTLELIQQLEEKEIATGCLSNTNEPHWLEMLEGDRFPNVRALTYKLASHELKLFKPDPAIYRAFEQAVEATGKEIAFFDDSPGNVVAARAIGWHAWTVDPNADTASQMRRALEEVGALRPRRLV